MLPTGKGGGGKREKYRYGNREWDQLGDNFKGRGNEERYIGNKKCLFWRIITVK